MDIQYRLIDELQIYRWMDRYHTFYFIYQMIGATLQFHGRFQLNLQINQTNEFELVM